MIEITNIQDNQEFFGEELEFFIDDETNIGEVYLDGDLIFIPYGITVKIICKKMVKNIPYFCIFFSCCCDCVSNYIYMVLA